MQGMDLSIASNGLRHQALPQSQGQVPIDRTAREEQSTLGNVEDRWLSRPELAARLGVPVKTLAEWASKGAGPRYAKFGKHIRYRLRDVIAWENDQFAA
jgi:predicted DNA-binding transcriptional regulator AlpA